MSASPEERADVEALADAVLDAVQRDAEDGNPSGMPDAVVNTLAAMRDLGISFVRRYHRLTVDIEAEDIAGPVLFVANHGFGGSFDLNVFATLAALHDLGLDRPVTALTHQVAWTLQVGRFVEPLGARPASRKSADDAFGAGNHVLVLPGGDIEAGKSFVDRDRIVFSGRRGFAKLAIEHDVPIVPIVTAGAGESLLVLSSGQRLARALRLDKALRLKVLPVSVSLPWGVSVGAVGMLPYLPLPTKLDTAVLPAMHPNPGETHQQFGERIEQAMQSRLTALTSDRRPILGSPAPKARKQTTDPDRTGA
jgi:1-acyl-sn-glycerol-3-phosphate acyltransferase